ncbi:unnamed protein product [Adineta ricciae]|uniref:G-protein coupled receptors family 1 profile domain-containing protein n=1 Tax=Adineta ricciae TaxID=249248 RepID=A0A814V253_ADIRI|nr:unnamed protein product [Adineta ricciae]CAF1612818.1 unnamed protein product [Adineta ricciae]
MNQTQVNTNVIATIEDYYLVALLSSVFGVCGIIISTYIMILIDRAKSRLRTVHRLLVNNTCFASIFYSVITMINYIVFIFAQWETSNIGCKWRAYLAYVGIAGVLHSYMIQAISCICSCVFSTTHRWLTTTKTHYCLIAVQWLIVLVITLSTLITDDVQYRPQKLCFIPIKKTLHAICAIFAYYIIPLATTIVIYVFIFCRMKKTIKINSTYQRVKRDLEALRNIIFLIGIYITSGLPSIIYFFSPSKYLYLINLATQSLAVTLATSATLLLDREICRLIRTSLCRTTLVVPFDNAHSISKGQANRHG